MGGGGGLKELKRLESDGGRWGGGWNLFYYLKFEGILMTLLVLTFG